jgi:hypothetical protein
MPTQNDRAGPTRWLSATGWLGVALGAIGATLLFLGWWQISGETLLSLQMPYVASASIPGATLVIAGATLLAGESTRRTAADSARLVETLFDLLTEASKPPPSGPQPATEQLELFALPGTTHYHRSGCVLLEGKPGVAAVDPVAIRDRGLRPSPICTPAQIVG